MTYKDRIEEMYEMINSHKTFEALEKYYHDDVVVLDNNSPIREGKEAQRKAIEQWYDVVKEFHGSGVTALTSDEENGITTVESWTDITFKDGNRIKIEEVGVQRWEGDKIKHERFYYQYDGPLE